MMSNISWDLQIFNINHQELMKDGSTLTQLTKIDQPFVWTSSVGDAFISFKHALLKGINLINVVSIATKWKSLDI